MISCFCQSKYETVLVLLSQPWHAWGHHTIVWWRLTRVDPTGVVFYGNNIWQPKVQSWFCLNGILVITMPTSKMMMWLWTVVWSIQQASSPDNKLSTSKKTRQGCNRYSTTHTTVFTCTRDDRRLEIGERIMDSWENLEHHVNDLDRRCDH